jgi:hypothetical protein
MLDYKKLRSEFTEKLNQFDADRLEQWISYDKRRKDLDRLLNGEKVTFHPDDIQVSILNDPRELISSIGESNYALAA